MVSEPFAAHPPRGSESRADGANPPSFGCDWDSVTQEEKARIEQKLDKILEMMRNRFASPATASTTPTTAASVCHRDTTAVAPATALGGPTPAPDSSTTPGSSSGTPDAIRVVAIDTTSLVAPMPARCSTEGPSRDAAKLMPAFIPAAAPTPPTAIFDFIPVLTATTTGDRILIGEVISDTVSLPATCSSECPSNNASVSTVGAAVIPSATMTWSMALEAVPPTAPTPLEDHRPPWPPPHLVPAYQPEYNPHVEESGVPPHGEMMILNSKSILAAPESYVRKLIGDCLLETFFQEERYSGCNKIWPEAKPLYDTCGTLVDHYSRLDSVILGVLIIWPQFSTFNITESASKEISFRSNPMSSVDNLLLRRYNYFSTWNCFGVGLWNDILLQDWFLSWSIGHITQCGFELLQWKIAWSLHWDCSEMASTKLKAILRVHLLIGLACNQDSEVFSIREEGIFCESKKLELNSWVSHMMEQYTDMCSYGIKTGHHSLYVRTSRALIQDSSLAYALQWKHIYLIGFLLENGARIKSELSNKELVFSGCNYCNTIVSECVFTEFQQLNMYRCLLNQAVATHLRANPMELFAGDAVSTRCSGAEFQGIIIGMPNYHHCSSLRYQSGEDYCFLWISEHVTRFSSDLIHLVMATCHGNFVTNQKVTIDLFISLKQLLGLRLLELALLIRMVAPWNPGELHSASPCFYMVPAYKCSIFQGGKNGTARVTCYFDFAGHNYYCHAFLDKIHFDHDYYFASLNKVPLSYDFYLDEAYYFDPVYNDLKYYREDYPGDPIELEEVHAPWDPGKSALRHPLKASAWGQAEFQEGRNVMTLASGCLIGPVSCDSRDGLDPTVQPRAEHCYMYASGGNARDYPEGSRTD